MKVYAHLMVDVCGCYFVHDGAAIIPYFDCLARVSMRRLPAAYGKCTIARRRVFSGDTTISFSFLVFPYEGPVIVED